HVWDTFVITALHKDSKHRMHSLTVPQTGDQWDRFMKAMMDRNRCIRLYGYEDVRRHYCNWCTHMYANDQGVSGYCTVSVVVVDGVTVSDPCCSVCNCHIPLSNNHHRFCPTHLSNDGNCSIMGCDLPVISGHRTCLTPAHQHVEKTYQLHGQSRFQLQEYLACSRVAHLNDAVGQDIDISTLHPSEVEEGTISMFLDILWLKNQDNMVTLCTLALPVIDSSSDPTSEQPTRRRLKAMFGCQRMHNEQLMVAPCGMIIARQTFFGAEGVVSVKDFIKNIYASPGAIKPDHIFFDNSCTISKMVKDDLFFEEISLSVDVFHFNCSFTNFS
ncbi:hypothetical protein F4604DRAFT_1570170, partial [Suillus subluteus]